MLLCTHAPREQFKMAAISKQEYLKRYLSNNDEGKKKKRKKKPKIGAKFAKSVVVDDDVSLSEIRQTTETETVTELNADEAPVVYDEDGVTAISTEHFKKREEDLKSMWVPVQADEEETEKKRHDSDSDASPPRSRRRHDSSDASPPRARRRHDSSDASPPRSRRRHDSSDASPPRKTRSESRDNSPPRNSKAASNSGLRDGRTLESPDMSPPRRTTKANDSPPALSHSRFRKQNEEGRKISRTSDSSRSSARRTHRAEEMNTRRGKGSDSDESPARRAIQRHDSPDQSPPRRRKRHDSDLSPPRKSDSDQSPPRRGGNYDSDLSPPRRGRGSDSDQSPPRKRAVSPRGRNRKENEKGQAVKKGGLLSAKDLREDNEFRRKRDKELLDKMDPTLSGRDAETVHRNKEGKIRNLKMERLRKREEEKKKEAEDEKFMQWGKGVVQTQSREKKLEDELHEMAKPLARYRNDADLEEMLRNQERQDDPMLAFMTKKKVKQDEKAGKKSKPVYRGPAPAPNRFGIRPGYRWDGVDRSNGFEKKRYQMLSNKKSTQHQAYKWSTEDM